MKEKLLIASIILCANSIFAQNLQLHYDFGEDRKYLTSTFEYFNADKLGNTFLFVDLDYNAGDVKGISGAYWEISRSLKFGSASPFAFHAEYNGGFLQWKDGDYSGIVQINDAWLGGVEYNYNSEDFSKGMTLMVLYKYIRDKHDASFQLTGVWYNHFLNNKMTFSGFADFWKEETIFIEDGQFTDTQYIFMTEPQLWYNFTKHFSLGTELEVSNNFGGVKGFQVNPTIGFKWNIKG